MKGVAYNIGENFAKSVECFGSRIAMQTLSDDGSRSLSYAELGKRVNELAYFISSLGVVKGDRVSIILENRPEWGMIFFALSYIGAVAVPLDPQMSEKDVRNILADSGARIVFISKQNKKLSEFLSSIEGISVVCIEEIKTHSTAGEFKRTGIEPDDLMLILYTSGTTDVPKGVMLTHKNLCSNFDSLSRYRLFSKNDVMLSILPLYHSYAMMGTFVLPILLGARVAYVPPDWPERLTEYIREAEATVFIGVPQIFHMTHSKIMKKLNELPLLPRLYIKLIIGLRLSRLFLPKIKNTFGKDMRFFVSGGAKLDKTVAKDFFRLGFRILEGYGLTETSPVASMNPLRRPRIGSAGRAIPDVEFKIVNKNAEGVGEIAIKGPNVMKGYYKQQEKTRAVIKDGWFLSGDLGYLDKDGYVYITGRSKEVIVLSSGKNIYPEEIEKHYSQTPYVKEMCVMGVLKGKGAAKLEYLHAIVVPDLEFSQSRGEMNIRKVIGSTFENLSKALPPYRHIMGFTVTQEALPRTRLGKIKRYEIEKKFLPRILDGEREEKTLSAEEERLLESETAKRLLECVKDSLDIKSQIHLSDSIELDLGVDSLGRVELVLAIEKRFGIEFPEEMVAGEIFTVKDVLFKVEELLVEKEQGASDKRQGAEKDKAVHWPEILKQALPQEFQKKISLTLGWTDYVFTFLIKGFIGLFFKVFYRLSVEGASKIPKKGPYILCVNHTSFLDGFIVAAALPFKTELNLFFIGFRRYFIFPIVRNMVRRARIIPIDATEIIEAMQGSSFILRHNKALCIFPEGERSIDGKLKEFKKGIGIISSELEVPLMPVFIKGAFEAWPRTERFPRLSPVKIRFGDPVSSQELVERGMQLGAADEHEAIALAIREEVESLHFSQ